MNNRFASCVFRLVLIVFFSLGFSSCSKKIISVATPSPPKTVDVEEIDFAYLHGRARMVYSENNKERDFRANIRLRKDSVIWMTLNLGVVQVAKALINKDSITIVSTVEKQYYMFDYAELTKRLHFKIDYHMIEAAILGNLIHEKNVNDEISKDGTFDLLIQTIGDVKIKNVINTTTKKIEKVDLSESSPGNSLHIEYSNFQPLAERTFPYQSYILVTFKTTSGGIINNTIHLEFSKAEVGDKELKFPFNIPRKYDRR